MKAKKFTSLLMITLMIFTVSSSYSTIKAEAENTQDKGYVLNFEISRPEFSDYESLNATYSNYWMNQPENNIFDRDKWNLNDFSVKHELHVEGEANTLMKEMSYSSANYSWDGKISFNDIKIPYDKVEVEYYNADNGGFVEPYLLHYNLYLKKSNDKMILSIPKLSPRENYENSTGDEKILTINNINIKELNPTIKTLYLNGQAGDDNFDGTTPEKAVKTFEKAKVLSAANQNIKQIVVIGTTEVQGDISLDGTNARILRAEGFNSYLFSVGSGKSASLSNIVVDGNSEKNTNIEKSLIEVKSNATLNINSGTNLKNNQIKAIKNTATTGGAIDSYSSTINLSGGIIENNQATYGGGVYLNKSIMNFSGGTIQNNRSDLVIDYAYDNQKYSSGGGILANEGSTINMSGDAKVLNNYAKEIGGGISLGSNQWGASNILKMSGGTIDGNTAGAAGGGIFVQAKYFTGGASKAYIDGGSIINNQMDASGYTEKMFGGGGIYVNGANNNYGVNGANGELYLTNVVITDNESENEGAGYAACPISKTKIYVTNGAAIYGNKTASKVNDIYILCNKYLGLHGGDPEYDISKRMLGGVLYNWKNKDNSPLDESKHKGVIYKNNEYLGLHTDEKGNELTSNLKKVLISGNKSGTRGGGIGSNGTVTIGTEETTSVSVGKKWIDDNNTNLKHPETVTVKLIAKVADKEYEIENKQLSEKNGWKTKFTDLPTKAGEEDIKYTIKEVGVEGYTSKISGTTKEGFVVTNTRIPQKTRVEVTKAWKDKNNQDGKRPDSVKIKLYADGKEVKGKSLILRNANNWKGSFTDLDEYKAGKKIEYTVKEEPVGFGYKSEIRGSAKDGYVITNIRVPNIPPEITNKVLPKTRDDVNLSLYAMLMGLSGLLLIAVEVVKGKRES
ncbi:Cna B-type domain-containing protein [Eubacteriales bacterium KG125]